MRHALDIARFLVACLCLVLAVAPLAFAKVPAEQAARLNAELTPLGAERAGNADGSIPAWKGGLTTAPAAYQGAGSWYVDPFPEDKALFTITAANLAEHQGRLSAGQLAMFQKYPQSYRMPVYPARRSAAYPQFYYDATHANATRAELQGNGETLVNAAVGIPFPMPQSGHEPIWNHKLRYRGLSQRRWLSQMRVNAAGRYEQVKLRLDAFFAYSQPGATPQTLNNILLYALLTTTAPAKLAGSAALVHETLDQVNVPRRAWEYEPKLRRVNRAPELAYDYPSPGTDGLRTSGQIDMFNGALDRYRWTLAGKQEIHVPYNSYKLHSNRHPYREIIRPGHINQELARYELHRVWVVDAVLKAGATHRYLRRTFYLDEDSWQILLVDIYGADGQLWRWQEAHSLVHYDKPFPHPIGELLYDLRDGRYLAHAFNNEEPEQQEPPFRRDSFLAASVQNIQQQLAD